MSPAAAQALWLSLKVSLWATALILPPGFSPACSSPGATSAERAWSRR